jgi:hypothetical protein
MDRPFNRSGARWPEMSWRLADDDPDPNDLLSSPIGRSAVVKIVVHVGRFSGH